MARGCRSGGVPGAALASSATTISAADSRRTKRWAGPIGAGEPAVGAAQAIPESETEAMIALVSLIIARDQSIRLPKAEA